jgi:hypothetical protein
MIVGKCIRCTIKASIRKAIPIREFGRRAVARRGLDRRRGFGIRLGFGIRFGIRLSIGFTIYYSEYK